MRYYDVVNEAIVSDPARQMTDDMRSRGYDGFIAVQHRPRGPLTHTELEIVKYD